MAMPSEGSLPSGCAVFATVPEAFFLPEFVFGGLVWILVASTRVVPDNPLGWVMFVSVFCFFFTTLLLLLSLCGANQSSVCGKLDVAYHALAAFFYLSASVALASVTIALQSDPANFKSYQEDIAAVVMSYVATLFYALHAVFSAIRWKRS
ncbi:myelin and lymphocyte protein-like [Conger conger]|uniref:myelin and lymphocyte protein-like n=1 Tax=Conger conger TaxID=82655 RepID=UPI002A5ADBAD|nr:myelin and lymphocyte protein-like [Conger conger]